MEKKTCNDQEFRKRSDLYDFEFDSVNNYHLVINMNCFPE